MHTDSVTQRSRGIAVYYTQNPLSPSTTCSGRRAMYDPQVPPTTPIGPPAAPQRRRWLPWAIGCVGLLVVCQLAGIGVVLAFPNLRAQIAGLWIRPSAPAPPESPLPASQAAPTRPLKI